MVATSNSSSEQSNQLTQDPKASQKWWAMLGLGIGAFMFAIDVYIINIALPILVDSHRGADPDSCRNLGGCALVDRAKERTEFWRISWRINLKRYSPIWMRGRSMSSKAH